MASEPKGAADRRSMDGGGASAAVIGSSAWLVASSGRL